MIRGLWDRETVAALLLAALVPLAVIWLRWAGVVGFGRLILMMILVGAWHVLFMLARAQPPSLAGLMTALALTVLGPADAGVVAQILSISFGVVMAELVFGGWGRNVLNPATVALAFIGFGFPGVPWPDLPQYLSWGAGASAVLAALFGVMSWRLLLGAAAVLGLAGWFGFAVGDTVAVALVVLVLLVGDPVASATSAPGRWANGILFALLAVLFGQLWAGAAPVQFCVSAALLASLAAPLFDEIALAAWLARRRHLG